tara:strand:+ start:56 stop:271 length:216 start_codon:yes stop_codon:yes gene_type:complete
MAKWEDYLEEGHLEKILTVGGSIAIAIGVSYIVKTYLDVLRIKLVKKQLKEENSSNNLTELPQQDWNINED